MKLKKYLSAIIGSLLLTLGVVTFIDSIGSKVVNAAEESTINLANGEYSVLGTLGIITWKDDSERLSITQEKGSSSTDVNSSYIATPRWYASNEITFSVVDGYNVSNLSITATTDAYANVLKKSTWSKGTQSLSGKVVTSTAVVTSSEPLIITMSAQSRISSIKFKLNDLSSIEPEDPEFTNAKASLDKVKAHMSLGYKYDVSGEDEIVLASDTINAIDLGLGTSYADGSTYTGASSNAKYSSHGMLKDSTVSTIQLRSDATTDKNNNNIKKYSGIVVTSSS